MANMNNGTRHPIDDLSERVPADPRKAAPTPGHRLDAPEPRADRGLGWSDALELDDIGDIADEGRGHRG
jgi:hypothetical protein